MRLLWIIIIVEITRFHIYESFHFADQLMKVFTQ